MKRIQLKNNNQVLEVSDESARIAVATGTAKYWSAPLPPVTVTWSVVTTQNGEVCIQGRCNRENCSTMRFTGRPEDASTVCLIHQHADGGSPALVPAEVIKNYAAAKKGEWLQLGSDTMDFFHNLNKTYASEKNRFDFPMKP